jgi:DNA-binding NarL/FixJ family response regulator
VSAPAASEPRRDARLLGELRALEREIVELGYVRRADALERVNDAVRRLGEVGSPDGILERAADELGASSQFDRVLISEVAGDRLQARAIWSRDDRDGARAALAELQRVPIALEYPSIEEEVARGQDVAIVDLGRSRARTPERLAAILAGGSYVVCALTVGGKTVGLLHADADASGRVLDELDREVAARYSDGLAGVFERAVLRQALRTHRSELQAAVQWIGGRLARLETDGGTPGPLQGAGGATVIDALTPRELEVLRLMARGQTNLAIANRLVVGEGTIKYHVKNILRKLGATSRADAVSRYVRARGASGMR